MLLIIVDLYKNLKFERFKMTDVGLLANRHLGIENQFESRERRLPLSKKFFIVSAWKNVPQKQRQCTIPCGWILNLLVICWMKKEFVVGIYSLRGWKLEYDVHAKTSYAIT
jgi:hypothetical protein